ncbi:MAG: DUF5683 domain-containing protein [bacterium]
MGVLVATFLFSGSVSGQVVWPDTTDRKGAPPESKSPWGAAVRSAVFPGWGQVYTEHYVKSGVIFLIESGLIVSAVMENEKANKAYEAAQSTTDEQYQKYLDRLERRNLYLWWTAGVIVYSMIDAYVDAHLFRFDEEGITLSVEPRWPRGVAIGLALRKAF